ncbi:MAG TPA: two-component regulator propeller domain-containing protein, partial [Catalimonadaceae bacterium]|nr:two-component regulator propeller domain-containing protein [Catalimonadaceae bacterium]
MSCFLPVFPGLFLPGSIHGVSWIHTAGWRIYFAFVLIISSFSKDGIAQNRKSLRFESFGVNEGLSQGNVTCMMQDRQRMLWFGTWDGVNLYDGFRNQSFHNLSYHSQNIRGLVINNIVELDSERVAICSYTGLDIFYISQQRFRHYADEPAFLNCRVLHKMGDTLILSTGSHLRIFNLRSHQFSHHSGKEAGVWKSALTNRKNGVNRSEFLFTRAYELLRKQPWAFSSLTEIWSQNTVNDIIWQPDQSRLFLGCEEGVLLVDFRNGSRQMFLEGTSIKSLAFARNQLFIGSQLAGLFVMDLPELNISGHYLHDEKNRHSIAGNYIRNLFVDDDQNIWLSVLGGGLSYASLQPKPARTLFSSFSLPAGSKQDNYIQSLAEDSAGRLWMYSVSGNLKVLNTEYNVIRTFTPEQIDPVALPVSVQQIFVDPDGTVFLLSNKGLYQETVPFRFARILQPDSAQGASYFQTMIRLAPGEYLLGTRSGVFFFDQKSAKLRPVSHPALDKEVIHFLFQDEKGRIYVNRFFKGVKVFSFNGQNLHELANIPTEANLKSAVETKTGILFAS